MVNRISNFGNREVKEAEALALRTLYQLRWALETYARSYSEGCYPEDLRVLGPAPDDTGQDDQTGPDHAALVAREFASNSFQSNGYKFSYEWNGGMFVLLARPVEYRKMGIRSFYVDRSSAIRYTDEDRDATAEDDPAENP